MPKQPVRRSSVRGVGAFEGLLSRVAHTNSAAEFQRAWQEVLEAARSGELTSHELAELQPVGIYLAQQFSGNDPGPIPALLAPFLRAHHDIAGAPYSSSMQMPPRRPPMPRVNSSAIGAVPRRSSKRPALPRATGYVPPETYAYAGNAFPAPRAAKIKPANMDEIGAAAIAAAHPGKLPARVTKLNKSLSACRRMTDERGGAFIRELKKAARLFKACTPAQKKFVDREDIAILYHSLLDQGHLAHMSAADRKDAISCLKTFEGYGITRDQAVRLHNQWATEIAGSKEGTMPKKVKKKTAKKAPKKKTTAKKKVVKKKKPVVKKAVPKKRKPTKKKVVKKAAPKKRKPTKKKVVKKPAVKKAAPKKRKPTKKKVVKKPAVKKAVPKKRKAAKKKSVKVSISIQGVGKASPKKKPAKKKKSGAKKSGHAGMSLHQERKGDNHSPWIALVDSGDSVYAGKFPHIVTYKTVKETFKQNRSAFTKISKEQARALRAR